MRGLSLVVASGGPLFIAVHGPLTIAASLVAEQRLQTLRLSSCGPRAQLLRGMWDLPRPGLEPVSPALAGRLSTTAPPGKPPFICSFNHYLLISHYVSGKALDTEIMLVNKPVKVLALISFQSGTGDRYQVNEEINKQERYQIVDV